LHSLAAIHVLKKHDTMDVRIQRISQICTDFLFFLLKIKQLIKKNPYKSVKSVESVHPFYPKFSKIETAFIIHQLLTLKTATKLLQILNF
jgi:hypothetical protein